MTVTLTHPSFGCFTGPPAHRLERDIEKQGCETEQKAKGSEMKQRQGHTESKGGKNEWQDEDKRANEQ